MNTFQKSFLALAIASCATMVSADYRVQYFVGYGIYYPFASDTSSTTPGDGLLARNGSHCALVQLLWAGPDGNPDPINPANPANGYVSDDDVVLESRIIEAGVGGYDEWLYNPTPPAPFNNTNSLQKPVFVRVYQDTTPLINDWYYDSPLVYPEDASIFGPPGEAFATLIHIENGGETIPTAGVVLPIWNGCLSCPDETWSPDQPSDPEIQRVEFDPTATGFTFDIPYSYSLQAVYGADVVLPSGDWNWQALQEGTDYTLFDDVVTLVTTGDGVAPRQMIRIGLIHNF